jgi:tripartite-type tricarboxylate transporter receptor subunit TctC
METCGFVPNLIATNPSLYAKLPYGWERDFRSVILYVRGFNVLTVSPSLRLSSVKELIEHARANPDRLKFGASGIGGTPHLSMELFKTMTGTAIVHIQYKAQQQTALDLIGGEIDIVCDNLTVLLPYVQSGRVRALAITSLKRLDVVPEIPTLHEAGVSGYEISAWGGFAVPTGVSPNRIQRLNIEINKALVSSTISKTLVSRGTIAVGGTPEEFAEHIRNETDKLGKLIKAIGIKPQ